MGIRAGGGAGFSSGIGSNKSYGLNKYERFTFEALKSNASASGVLLTKTTKGQNIFHVAGQNFTESGLAKFIKSEFKTQKEKTGQSDKSMAKQITKYLTNNKTGDFFGNMADNI